MQLNAIHSCECAMNHYKKPPIILARVHFQSYVHDSFGFTTLISMHECNMCRNNYTCLLRVYRCIMNIYIYIFFQIATLCLTKFIANKPTHAWYIYSTLFIDKKNDPEINPSDCSAHFYIFFCEIYDSVPRYFMSKFSCLFDISLKPF